MDITKLPDSLLLCVFKYLPLSDLCGAVRTVDKKWHDLSYDLSLWNTVDLRSRASHLTDWDLVTLLSQIGEHVVHLNLRTCAHISGLPFLSIKVNCPNLKTIDISETSITEDKLCELFTNTEKFPVLESVTFEVQNSKRVEEFYRGCCEAYRVGRKLTTITNPCPFGLDPHQHRDDVNIPLLSIAALFTTLQSFTVSQSNLESATLEAICKQNPGIRTLNVNNCKWVSDNIAGSVSHLSSLTQLDISDTVTNDAQFSKAIAQQPGLKTVNISGCHRITDVGISMLGEKCRNLRSFIAHENHHTDGTMTDNGLSVIACNCPFLRELTLVCCRGVTDTGLQALALKCRKLATLNVIRCHTLTDASFLAVAENCQELQTLKASECREMTSVSVNALVVNCTRLHVLELDSCRHLSTLFFRDLDPVGNVAPDNAHSVENLIEYSLQRTLLSSPCRLRVLDLSYCPNVTTDSVTQIAHYCVTLRNLSLRGCYLVTDAAIEAVARRCVLLNILDVSGSTTNHSQLTDRSLTALADHAANLVMLSLTKSALSTEAVLSVVRKCPTLRRLQLEVGAMVKVNHVISATRTMRRSCRIRGREIFINDGVHGSVLLTMPPLKTPI